MVDSFGIVKESYFLEEIWTWPAFISGPWVASVCSFHVCPVAGVRGSAGWPNESVTAVRGGCGDQVSFF